jgi:hypothetical protein
LSNQEAVGPDRLIVPQRVAPQPFIHSRLEQSESLDSSDKKDRNTAAMVAWQESVRGFDVFDEGDRDNDNDMDSEMDSNMDSADSDSDSGSDEKIE